MAKERPDQNRMTPEETQDRIWELARKIDFCMFTSWNGERQNTRPLSARVRREEHAIYFLVDVHGEKNAEIEQYPAVSCGWADNGGHKYVVISGKAELLNDRQKISDVWTDFDKAWWEDKNDPTVRLVKLVPEEGELWDGPNGVIALTKMAIAVATGRVLDMGQNSEVKL